MRAVEPSRTGTIQPDGVSIGYNVFGTGEPTILLLPTWTIIHTRFWKMQIPYLARHYRVVTYDGPGNGLSDRSTDPSRYSFDAYAAYALAVLEDVGVDRAIVIGVSAGAGYALKLSSTAPDRVAGLVLVGPALALAPLPAARARTADTFLAPYPENPEGWEKYNLAYWHDHYQDFVTFFFEQVFSEPHSTKAREDAVGWALETSAEVLEANERQPTQPTGTGRLILEALSCPVLIVHGTDDRLIDHQVGVEAAKLSGGTLLTFGDSGHFPNVRDPVKFNLAVRAFIERVAA